MKFEEIKEGSILYIHHQEVRVNGKFYDIDRFGKKFPAVEIDYLYQPQKINPQTTGPDNLSTEPIHCLKCKHYLIDKMNLRTCPRCKKFICPSPTCRKCWCGTDWKVREHARL